MGKNGSGHFRAVARNVPGIGEDSGPAEKKERDHESNVTGRQHRLRRHLPRTGHDAPHSKGELPGQGDQSSALGGRDTASGHAAGAKDIALARTGREEACLGTPAAPRHLAMARRQTPCYPKTRTAVKCNSLNGLDTDSGAIHPRSAPLLRSKCTVAHPRRCERSHETSRSRRASGLPHRRSVVRYAASR